ncbi:hypothetical protein Aab01nite_77810 [Paractinoplanes abujensis]|uniref:Uncharacterized protein n=1 Tax=Paractinoplanes abujensis TaxID=882441 RepID=A0A7W7CSV0_9ACTN|nr:TFIIB-type zinc ribbon-containing protein [Actinoplanes abujensis]MBB4692331.1 hypothetical protein [Actinoplanes abujensis]GID24191.1 hypothetical protein Aab01nite_77810 [Actinoplanes abujensis]
MRRYRYVGPADIQESAGRVEPVRLDAAGRLPDEPLTFVVGVDGWLKLAPRRSEHVVLADGQDVLAAGEMTFDGERRVVEVSNQSTGYCPDPDCWPAVAAALDRLGTAHPGGFTHELTFRRCPDCGERNIVRDGDFTCALCGGDLPTAWNFSSVPDQP